MKLDKITEIFLENKRFALKPSTYERYRTCLNYVPALKLKKLSTAKLQKLLNGMAAGGLSTSSIRQTKILINQSINYARGCGYAVGADFSGVIMPKKDPKKVAGVSSGVVSALLNPNRVTFYDDFFRALLFSGARVGEMIALEWRNVALREGFIKIEFTDYHGQLLPPKTPESVRKIPISDRFRAVLLRKITPGASGRVFTNTLGRPIVYRTVLDAWHRYLYAVGAESCGLHALRHTFATESLRAGIDVKVLSRILGHSSVAITLDIYTDVSDVDKITAINRLDRFLTASAAR